MELGQQRGPDPQPEDSSELIKALEDRLRAGRISQQDRLRLSSALQYRASALAADLMNQATPPGMELGSVSMTEPSKQTQEVPTLLISEGFFNKVETSAYDQMLHLESNASITRTSQGFTVAFPSGCTRPIPSGRLFQTCIEVISNTFPEWPSLISEQIDVLSINEYARQTSSADLAVIGGLFLITSELLKELANDSSLATSTRIIQPLLGKKFHDFLPARKTVLRVLPPNCILVPSLELQQKIGQEDKQEVLFRNERLHRCKVTTRAGETALFHYRPFHVLAVNERFLKDVAQLNQALKTEYQKLLND